MGSCGGGRVPQENCAHDIIGTSWIDVGSHPIIGSVKWAARPRDPLDVLVFVLVVALSVDCIVPPPPPPPPRPHWAARSTASLHTASGASCAPPFSAASLVLVREAELADSYQSQCSPAREPGDRSDSCRALRSTLGDLRNCPSLFLLYASGGVPIHRSRGKASTRSALAISRQLFASVARPLSSLPDRYLRFPFDFSSFLSVYLRAVSITTLTTSVSRWAERPSKSAPWRVSVPSPSFGCPFWPESSIGTVTPEPALGDSVRTARSQLDDPIDRGEVRLPFLRPGRRRSIEVRIATGGSHRDPITRGNKEASLTGIPLLPGDSPRSVRLRGFPLFFFHATSLAVHYRTTGWWTLAC